MSVISFLLEPFSNQKTGHQNCQQNLSGCVGRIEWLFVQLNQQKILVNAMENGTKTQNRDNKSRNDKIDTNTRNTKRFIAMYNLLISIHLKRNSEIICMG